MLNTYVYRQFVPPSSGRPLRYLIKNCMLFATLQKKKSIQ